MIMAAQRSPARNSACADSWQTLTRSPGQRALDEDRLAVQPGYSPALVVQRFDNGLWHRIRLGEMEAQL
jgi:hypothetical protein